MTRMTRRARALRSTTDDKLQAVGHEETQRPKTAAILRRSEAQRYPYAHNAWDSVAASHYRYKILALALFLA